MICHEVHLQLSAFLEKSLDATRMKNIETHLNSCAACRAEADDLLDCIRQVAGLPVIEPPAGFAQRVMAHVREIEIEPRGWRSLAASLRTALSIPAAATVIIAVVAVFLYRNEPRLNVADSPQANEASAPSTPVEQKDSLATTVAQTPESPGRSSAERTATVSRPMGARRIEPAPETVSTEEQTSPQLATGAETRSDSRVATVRRPTIQAQEVATGRRSYRSGTEPFGFGAGIGALSQVPFRDPPFTVGLSPLSEPGADIELIVRRRPWQRQGQAEEANDDVQSKRSEADAAIASAAARGTVPAPGVPSSSVVEMRWFGVPAHRYEQFRSQLAAEAHIDSERAITSIAKEASGAQQLVIKVIILPSDR